MQRLLTEREMFGSNMPVFPCISLHRTCDYQKGLQTEQALGTSGQLCLSACRLLPFAQPGSAHGNSSYRAAHYLGIAAVLLLYVNSWFWLPSPLPTV